jgi:hypothetical protein
MNQPRQSDDDVEAHGNIPAANTPASTHPAMEEGPDVEGHVHTPASVEP